MIFVAPVRALIFIDITTGEILLDIVPETAGRVRVTAIIHTDVRFAVGIDDETFHKRPSDVIAVYWIPEHIPTVSYSILW